MLRHPSQAEMLRQVLLGLGLDKSHAAKPKAEQELILSKALKIAQRMGDVSVAFRSREGWDPSLLHPWTVQSYEILLQFYQWFTHEEFGMLDRVGICAESTAHTAPQHTFLAVRDLLKIIAQVRELWQLHQ